MSGECLKISSSRFSAAVTLKRLKEAMADAGVTVFAHIDQAAAAREVGLDLAPLDLLLFGNPRSGTPLMHVHPTIGIDLPLKVIVWQDLEGVAWIGLNDPAWIAARHGLGEEYSQIVTGMGHLQAKLAARAASGLSAEET